MYTHSFTHSTTNLTRIARVSLSLVGIAAALIGAAGAKADTIFGNVGQYTDRGATCYHNGNYNQVIVQPPNMSSSPVSVANNGNGITFNVGGGAYGGGFHVQPVAYRAYIKKWNAATNTWDYITAGSWRFSSFGDALSPAIGWYNLDGSGDSDGGSTFFNINQSGYYQVDLVYYWWADSQSGAGAAWNTVASYDGNQYCAF